MASQDEKARFFQALFWAAWADDALLEVEQKVLRDLMSNADLGDSAREEVESWFMNPPDEPDWAPLRADEAMAEALMRDYALVVLVDGVVNLDEMEQLTHVQEALGMDESTLHAILKDVEASIATN